jgi:methionine-rich copper-binding protein CopC
LPYRSTQVDRPADRRAGPPGSRTLCPRPLGRGLVVGLALLLLGLGLGWAPRPAYAVTPVASEPRNREELDQPPGAVTLAFRRDVDPGVAKVIVTGPKGDNVTEGSLIVEGTNVTTQLKDGLDRGTYTVHYRIDRPDGAPEGGALQFSYGKGSFKTPADRSWSGSAKEPAVLSGTNPNSSDEPEPPVTNTPGVEVTEQGTSTDPEPPPTDPPSSVEPPPGPASSQPTGSAQAGSTTAASPAPTSGGSKAPLVIGIVVLAALVGGGLGVWRTRRNRPSAHE